MTAQRLGASRTRCRRRANTRSPNSSGLTHEWQIGTRATTALYQTEGITIPDELRAAATRLRRSFRADLHDIEYDLFQPFAQADPSTANDLGITRFIADVAQASDRSGAGTGDTGLQTDITGLQTRASQLLRALVERKGADYVARFFHE